MRRFKTVVISCIMVTALAMIVGMNVTGPHAQTFDNGSAKVTGVVHSANLDG